MHKMHKILNRSDAGPEQVMTSSVLGNPDLGCASKTEGASTHPEVIVDDVAKDEVPVSLQQMLSTNQQILAHILIWIFAFVLGFSNSVFRILTPYVVSDFKKHALTATTDIVANIASAIFRLPYARLLDVWGRPHSLTIMVTLTVIGDVMMAVCRNVETYCAAQVFYYVGYYGIQFSLVIFISDSTPIRNRALLLGVISSPTLISTWAAGPAAERILSQLGYRWGFELWGIIIPIVSGPLLTLMFKFDSAARKAGLIKRPEAGGERKRSVISYLQEFDALGLTVLAAGLSLLLLSFSIFSYQEHGWRSPLIICFLVFGPVLIVVFIFYELHLSSTSFLPRRLVKNRTVIWTNVMAATLYMSKALCSAYTYSMLIVVFDQSVTQAAYIGNIYYMGASLWSLFIGFTLRFYGRIKVYGLVLGLPLFVLGHGLLIAFRPGFTPISLMIVVEVLVSFGGGTMYLMEQMSLMTVSQEHTPALLAVESVIIDIGKSAGAAIATGIWTSMLRNKLIEYMPADKISQVDEIYGSLDAQSSFPPTTPTRLAIDHAYLDVLRVSFIASTALLAIPSVSIFFWEDLDVKKMAELRKIS